VIDPAVIVYAGFIGGSGSDRGYGVAVDADGAAYVVGVTQSRESTFPVNVGPDLTFNGDDDDDDTDAFIVKVLPDGSGLAYAGYIGGDDYDHAWGVAVGADGAAYVVGQTNSSDTTFPVIVGPDLTSEYGHGGGFIAKVLPDGSGLAYAGYILCRGVAGAVDAENAAYVAGGAGPSAASSVIVGPDLTYNDNGGNFAEDDAFITKVLPSGSGLAYAGYIGGSDNDLGTAIAVDASGAAFVVGSTASDEATFPASVGPDLTYNGSNGSGDFGDVFVAKVLPDGSGLVYAGYIGGNGYEWINSVAVDPAGWAYVVGPTGSSEASFPVIGGPDLTYNGGRGNLYCQGSTGWQRAGLCWAHRRKRQRLGIWSCSGCHWGSICSRIY